MTGQFQVQENKSQNETCTSTLSAKSPCHLFIICLAHEMYHQKVTKHLGLFGKEIKRKLKSNAFLDWKWWIDCIWQKCFYLSGWNVLGGQYKVGYQENPTIACITAYKMAGEKNIYKRK